MRGSRFTADIKVYVIISYSVLTETSPSIFSGDRKTNYKIFLTVINSTRQCISANDARTFLLLLYFNDYPQAIPHKGVHV